MDLTLATPVPMARPPLDDADRRLLSALQGGLPVCARPYARLGERAGLSEDEVLARLGQDAGKALDVPRANVELFRRHEAEIKKYAMNALAYVGL